MKITVKAEAKEIATLVSAVQERQKKAMSCKCRSFADADPNDLVKEYKKTLKHLTMG